VREVAVGSFDGRGASVVMTDVTHEEAMKERWAEHRKKRS